MVARIEVALKDPLPEEIDAGATFPLAITIAAPPECSLAGAPFSIKESDRIVCSGELGELTGDQHDTVELTLTAPDRAGEITWTFALLPRDVEGVQYEAAALDFSFKTRPHATSLAVWGVPSPVVAGHAFSVNIGAKCTVGCAMAGKTIEIVDEAGNSVAAGSLGDVPWPGTDALFWTSVTLHAPADTARFSWTARFSAAGSGLPHDHASASLGFLTVDRPEHRVSVKVVAKETQSPIADAQVRLGVHRAPTDESGVARLDVPGGEHELSVWKSGYDAPDQTIAVTKTEDVTIEMIKLPEEDPFRFWRG